MEGGEEQTSKQLSLPSFFTAGWFPVHLSLLDDNEVRFKTICPVIHHIWYDKSIVMKYKQLCLHRLKDFRVRNHEKWVARAQQMGPKRWIKMAFFVRLEVKLSYSICPKLPFSCFVVHYHLYWFSIAARQTITTPIYDLEVSVGQESGYGFAGCFAQGLKRVQCSQGWGLIWNSGSSSKLVVIGRIQFLAPASSRPVGSSLVSEMVQDTLKASPA